MGRHPGGIVRKLVPLALLLSIFLAGCGEEKTEMTKAEQENFRGGPMPAGFLDKNGPAQGPPK